MINLKVLTTVAVMALVLPMVAPGASFAAPPGKGGSPGSGGGRAVGGGGGGGGNFRGAAPAARFSGGGAPGPRFSGGDGSGGGRAWRGGNAYRGGGGGGGNGFIPGAIAGAVIGGAIVSGGYGGPGYYDQGYYGDQYYDGSAAVAVVPDQSDDGVAYCMQTYRSYDPRLGSYMGNDGYRHPCP